MATAEPVSQ